MTFPMNTKYLIKCRRRTQIAMLHRKIPHFPTHPSCSACDDTHNLFNFHASVSACMCLELGFYASLMLKLHIQTHTDTRIRKRTQLPQSCATFGSQDFLPTFCFPLGQIMIPGRGFFLSILVAYLLQRLFAMPSFSFSFSFPFPFPFPLCDSDEGE